MSEIKEELLFLEEVKLEGFKSIQDVSIEFKNGLNIIIGKNAAGKTNFLTFLNYILNFEYEELIDFYSKLSFSKGRNISFEVTGNVQKKESLSKKMIASDKIEEKVLIDEKLVEEEKNSNSRNILGKNGVEFQASYLRHGVPEKYLIVDEPLNFSMNVDVLPAELFKRITEEDNPYFIRSIMAEFVFGSLGFDDKAKKPMTEARLRNQIKKHFSRFERVKVFLEDFSPIKDIRLAENFSVFLDSETKKFTVKNIHFEFKVSESWYPFTSLSDGTKRLFYIISELSTLGNLHFTKNSFGLRNGDLKRIILLEEPELGIHPHQLMHLMHFIKEISKDHQIILATHSPLVLDILDQEELDRIIIAESKGGLEGTKLRHLSDDEFDKAITYIKEDFLSDYWVHSDLEKS